MPKPLLYIVGRRGHHLGSRAHGRAHRRRQTHTTQAHSRLGVRRFIGLHLFHHRTRTLVSGRKTLQMPGQVALHLALGIRQET